jgi:hypothetical protein
MSEKIYGGEVKCRCGKRFRPVWFEKLKKFSKVCSDCGWSNLKKLLDERLTDGENEVE